MTGEATRTRAAPGEAQAFVTKAIRWKSDDCLLWPFAMSGRGTGKGKAAPCVGNGGKIVRVRHLLLEMTGWYKPGPLFCASVICENDFCVNPSHLFWNEYKSVTSRQVAAGTKVRPPPEVFIHRGGEHAHAVLAETARKVFATTGSARKVALKMGIGLSTVHAIRAGKHWTQRDGLV